MAFVIGAFQTPFRRASERTHAELAAAAVEGALHDAGLESGDVEAVWFGSPTAGWAGQPVLAGPAILMGLVTPGVPITTVDGACATGALALYGAWLAITAGQCDVALAVGVDVGQLPDVVADLDGVVLAPGEWEGPPPRHDRERFGRRQAQAVADAAWQPSAERPVLMDLAALEARYAFRSGSVGRGDLAAVAAKSRLAGADNPNAWLREPMRPEAVLAAPATLDPFTKPMSCGLVDGGAAVVLVSEYGLARLPSKARAVRIAGMATGGGTWRTLGQRPHVERVARRAFSLAGAAPSAVDVAEVHDNTAYAELKWLDALGLGTLSEVAAWSRGGETARDGRLPVNLSGGLLSRGHALAATGLAQIGGLVAQLRGEAGRQQVGRRAPRLAVAHNGGGAMGFDDALSVVTVLRAQG